MRNQSEITGKHNQPKTEILLTHEFKYNVVKDILEFRKLNKVTGKPSSEFREYTDRDENDLYHYLLENDMELTKDKIRSFIDSSKVSPEYNPFLDYFNDLEWDQKDYIQELANTVETDNNELFKATLKRYLVGVVDCLLNANKVNDVCLVFQSKQGTGKTRWTRRLLPKKFGEYIQEGSIDTKNKDHQEYLSSFWLIHLDELEAIKGNSMEALKSFITRSKITHRKAFGRYRSNFIRRASFIGSVNDDKFLTDTTGNRRWLIFKTMELDYQHDVNIDGVWAQAYNLLLSGFRYWFEPNEIRKLNERNEAFRVQTKEEELLLLNFDFPENSAEGQYLSSSEIVAHLIDVNPRANANCSTIILGRVLNKYCHHKKRPGGLNKYLVLFKGNEQQSESVFEPIGNDDDLPI